MTTAVASPLTVSDRCDRCGSQAYIRVRIGNGGELLFCGHHGRRHEDALRPQAAEWHDETNRLTADSTTSTATRASTD